MRMGFSEAEVLRMTALKFFTLYDEYQYITGTKKEPIGIDDLP